MSERAHARRAVEWPTLALMAACYGIWVIALFFLTLVWLPLAISVTVAAVALHSSLTHEALHGHPFRDARLNQACVFPCLGLFIPYRRFRDLHLAHHQDAILTDPYDDPETNYLDPAVWANLPGPVQWLLRINNTLAGRMLLGPAISLGCLVQEDMRAMRTGEIQVRQAWAAHALGLVPVLGLILWSPMPVWSYLMAAYGGFSILKIRTFLEHRAHERACGRTVVIEDRGPLAFLFLNNNLHAVHHRHPGVAWYQLPRLFTDNRDSYLGRNGHYYYRSYREIFAHHFLSAKDPVAHPIWEKAYRQEPAE